MKEKKQKIINFKYEKSDNDLIRVSFEASEKIAVKKLQTIINIAGAERFGFPMVPKKRPFDYSSYYAYSNWMAIDLNQDKKTERWTLSAFPIGLYIHQYDKLFYKAQSIKESISDLEQIHPR